MDIEARLTAIEEELALGHAEQPEAMLQELIKQMGRHTLTDWRATLEPVIDRFQPKRRQRLRESLDARIEGRTTEVAEPAPAAAYPAAPRTLPRADFGEARLRDDLQELSEKHIFQWATSYRNRLFPHLEDHMRQIEVNPDGTQAGVVRRCFAEHAHDIFH